MYCKVGINGEGTRDSASTVYKVYPWGWSEGVNVLMKMSSSLEQALRKSAFWSWAKTRTNVCSHVLLSSSSSHHFYRSLIRNFVSDFVMLLTCVESVVLLGTGSRTVTFFGGKVTTGLAESDGSLPPEIVTCRSLPVHWDQLRAQRSVTSMVYSIVLLFVFAIVILPVCFSEYNLPCL